MSPAILDKLGVPYQKVVQEERNAIIVFPYAYHSGFNHGFNIAESTNFALERWIEYGKRARQCDCSRTRVTFSMDTFVQKFQPQLYEDWKNGRDIQPHPEDPPEIVEEIKLRASNPAEYARMMEERFRLGPKGKPRNTCPSLSEESRTLKIYQHHEMTHLKVYLTDDFKCQRGLERLKDFLSIENPDFIKLIDTGTLIFIGEEVDLKRSQPEEPEFIMQDVAVYVHSETGTEAYVNPITLELVGEQPQELAAVLDGKTAKELIVGKLFEFSSVYMIKLPNPSFRKRQKIEVKNVEMRGLQTVGTVYKHLKFNEVFTLDSSGKLIGKCPSEKVMKDIENKTVSESKDVIAVGKRKVQIPVSYKSSFRQAWFNMTKYSPVFVGATDHSLIYFTESDTKELGDLLRKYSFATLCRNKLLKKDDTNQDVDQEIVSAMLACISSPCVIDTCVDHRYTAQDIICDNISQKEPCGCRVSGFEDLADNVTNVISNSSISVRVDEKTSTVSVKVNDYNFHVKTTDHVPVDIIGYPKEKEYDYYGDLVDVPSEEEEAEQEQVTPTEDENSMFTSDDSSEETPATSDDPDWGGGGGGDSEWKAKKKGFSRSHRGRGGRGNGDGNGAGNGGMVRKRRAVGGYDDLTKIVTCVFDHFENEGNSFRTNEFAATDLALSLQLSYSDVDDYLNILAVFKVVSVEDELWTWHGKDDRDILAVLKTFYRHEDESRDYFNNSWQQISSKVLNCFLHSRRVSLFLVFFSFLRLVLLLSNTSSNYY